MKHFILTYNTWWFLSNQDVRKINNRKEIGRIDHIVFVFCVIDIKIILINNGNTYTFRKKVRYNQDCMFLFNKVITQKKLKTVKMTFMAVLMLRMFRDMLL